MGWTLRVGCMLSDVVVTSWKLVETRFEMICEGRCRIWAMKYEKFRYLGREYDAVRWRKW